MKVNQAYLYACTLLLSFGLSSNGFSDENKSTSSTESLIEISSSSTNETVDNNQETEDSVSIDPLLDILNYTSETVQKKAYLIKNQTNGWISLNDLSSLKNDSSDKKIIIEKQPIQVVEELTFNDGTIYYHLQNTAQQSLGYVLSTDVQFTIPSEEVNKYYTLFDANSSIYTDLNLTTTVSTNELLNKTFYVKDIHYVSGNKNYLSLYNSQGNLIGYIENTDQTTLTDSALGAPKKLQVQYISVVVKNSEAYADINLNTIISTNDLLNTAYKIEETYTHFNGTEYFPIQRNNQTVAYVSKNDTQKLDNAYGEYIPYNKYVTINQSNYDIYQNFDFEKRNHSSNYINQTLQARGYYNHYNGQRYLSLYDNKNNWIGYIEENATKLLSNGAGPYQPYDKYVTIKSPNYDIWQNFDWQKRAKSSTYTGQTLQARGYYQHFNGSRYLSLYDNQGNWVGYINETGTKLAAAQGNYHSYGKYVTIKSPNFDIWQNFDWQKRAKSSAYNGQTLQARGYYQHFNGSRYLSLYDNAGKWVGYMNETGTKLAANRGGVYHPYNKYVTIKSPNYDIWQNFNWKKQAKSFTYSGQTLYARGYYQHFNGKRYLSIYDNKEKWIGYMNETGTKVTTSQGNYHSYGKYVTIKSPNYDIWQNFDWQKRAKSSTYNGKTLEARGYYNHFNGSRYLSLYDNKGRWIGYMNETGTFVSRGAASYLQTSRDSLIKELSNNSKYYLGTPFRGTLAIPDSVMSPIGNPNRYGPGFNCTGFIATAIKNSGGNINKISNITSGIGGVANAYNWRDALTAHTDYYTYSSVQNLLNDGKAKKGDLIYFEADFTKPFYDCHIGFFWGDSPSQNRMWHSTLTGGGNNITPIFSGTPFSKILLIPMD